jgi:hypothetical protein
MDMGGMRGNMPAGAQVLPGNYSGVGRGVGQESHTPFPRTLTVQQQDEQLARLYSQQSQQRVSSTTGVAGANMGGTAGETMSEHGGEEVDELRREEMQAEARKARLEARRHLGDM